MIRNILISRVLVGFRKHNNYQFHTATANWEEETFGSFGKSGSNLINRQTSVDLAYAEKALKTVYQPIHDEILDEHLMYHKNVLGLRKRYSRLIDHFLNLDSSFLSTALLMVHAYKSVEKPSRLTEENLKKAAVLGWSFLLVEASLIVYDDIYDNSSIRYGKPTWFKLVGANEAMFDAAFLQTASNFLLLNHFSSHPQHKNIHKQMCIRSVGASISIMLDGRKHPFSEVEKHENFLKFITFGIPSLKAVLYLANIGDEGVHSAAVDFAIEFSKYLKNENDIKCVFGSISEVHKDCTDVELGRSTWMAVQVSKIGTPPQKKIMEEHYGKNNKKSVAIIHNLYKEMRLDQIYDEYKNNFYEMMKKKIMKMPKELPPQLFLDILECGMMGRVRY